MRSRLSERAVPGKPHHVYPEDLAADVTLHFDSGERYRFGEVAVRPSADSIVHGAVAPDVVRPLRMRADVRVTLGDDVQYRGANLTTPT